MAEKTLCQTYRSVNGLRRISTLYFIYCKRVRDNRERPSPTIARLRSRRENSLQGDAKVECQVRHHIVVRQAAASRSAGLKGPHRQACGVCLISLAVVRLGEHQSGAGSNIVPGVCGMPSDKV